MPYVLGGRWPLSARMALKNKRPNRLLRWETRLRQWFEARGVTDHSAQAAGIAAMSAAEPHDYRTAAVAIVFFKVTQFRKYRALLDERRLTGVRRALVHKETGEDLAQHLRNIGLHEFARFPKRRWEEQLVARFICRLHRVGFAGPEIARLLPDDDDDSPAAVRRGAKRIAAVVRKYLPTYQHDYAPAPLSWPQRVPPRPARAG
ncbi:MAG: hypothetical protein RL685_5713 [Pseudomonadota bacterium]|jgi:hypothetical protein